ncbi:hypothetical protein ABIB80_004177 [Bradyrhizobium sp. i1.15.2]
MVGEGLAGMFWVLQVVGSNPAAPTSPEVGRNRTREQQPVGEAPGDPGESAAAEHGARSVPMPGAAKALQTLGAHSLPNATSARFFKPLGRSGGAEIVKLCRTFCRRHARIGVGGFQRPMPNGRRQAMIFRLRGVTLFRPSVRRVPAERKRQERPGQLIVVGGLPRVLLRRLRGQSRRRRTQRQAHTCTLQIHRGGPRPLIVFKNLRQPGNNRTSSKRRAHSQITHSLGKSATAFNRSCRARTGSKVDRLG